VIVMQPVVNACNPVVMRQIKALVAPILGSSDTLQDRQRRLARLGFTISRSEEGSYLATLPHGLRIMALG